VVRKRDATGCCEYHASSRRLAGGGGVLALPYRDFVENNYLLRGRRELRAPRGIRVRYQTNSPEMARFSSRLWHTEAETEGDPGLPSFSLVLSRSTGSRRVSDVADMQLSSTSHQKVASHIDRRLLRSYVWPQSFKSVNVPCKQKAKSRYRLNPL
jgi:hypothetical protein